jgi:plasmid stability protein
MSALLTLDLDPAILARLTERAKKHGRPPEVEAKIILMSALQSVPADPWAEADAIRQRLAASGRTFSDSTELVREDRDR